MLFYVILCTFTKSCLSLGSWYRKRSFSYQELFCVETMHVLGQAQLTAVTVSYFARGTCKKKKKENFEGKTHSIWSGSRFNHLQSSDNSLVFLCPFQRMSNPGIASKPVVNPTVLKINDGKRFVKSTSKFSVLLAEKSRAETCLLSELSLRFSPSYNS